MAKSATWREVAELIGITAIVVSLIAVVVELRQTQAAISAGTYQARAFDGMTSAREQYNGDYIAPILARVDLEDPNSLNELSEEERFRLRIFYLSQMIDFDNEFYQYQNGFLDEEYFEYVSKRRLPGVARRWRNLGFVEPRPSFRSFVDEQLESN
jgi:hypothetical protein